MFALATKWWLEMQAHINHEGELGGPPVRLYVGDNRDINRSVLVDAFLLGKTRLFEMDAPEESVYRVTKKVRDSPVFIVTAPLASTTNIRFGVFVLEAQSRRINQRTAVQVVDAVVTKLEIAIAVQAALGMDATSN